MVFEALSGGSSSDPGGTGGWRCYGGPGAGGEGRHVAEVSLGGGRGGQSGGVGRRRGGGGGAAGGGGLWATGGRGGGGEEGGQRGLVPAE